MMETAAAESPAAFPVQGWFAGATRPLFVHAHPDDESITTGGTLAGLTAQGIAAGVITCTRGEMGEVLPGEAEQQVRDQGLAAVREAELRRALSRLGVAWHCYLGASPAKDENSSAGRYEDSGMEWGANCRAVPSPASPAAAFTRQSPAFALRDLLLGVVAYGTDALISYDLGGGYGHPDHVLAHKLTRAVAEALELPFWVIVPVRTGDAASAARLEDASKPAEKYDVSPWLAVKTAALAEYETQLRVADGVITHVGGQTEPVASCETYRRIF